MAANHIVEAKKAQALREQADALKKLATDIELLKKQTARILALLEPKQKAASEPKTGTAPTAKDGEEAEEKPAGDTGKK
jgi:hypothetical protein